MLVPLCLGFLYLVSQVGTTNLGGGFIFSEGSIGSFRSGPSEDFSGEEY